METHGKDLIESEVLRLQAELEDQRKMAVRLAVVEAQIRPRPAERATAARAEAAGALARAAEAERSRAEAVLRLEATLRDVAIRRFDSPIRRWTATTRRT